MTRIDWTSVLLHASNIVRTYDTGVTLRQLFYRLVADGTLPNTSTAYKQLTATTAEARRRGAFPDLIDLTRTIHRQLGFKGPEDAMGLLEVTYRRDRTEYMDRSIYLGVEKAGLVAQLEAWFGERGLPVLALSGFASESYVRQVVYDIRMWRRPAILLYAGDFDASGEDISRDFAIRTGCWDKVIRVALTSEQVKEFDLPKAVGKASDSRAAAFEERHGELVQVELDALPPNVLRSLFETALARFWDESAFQQSLRVERLDRIALFGMDGR
jgi:hypothetical protein